MGLKLIRFLKEGHDYMYEWASFVQLGFIRTYK